MKGGWRLARRVWPYVRRYRSGALRALLTVSGCSLLGLLTPWPMKILIDSVLQDHPLPLGLNQSLGPWSQQKVALLAATVAAGFLLSILQNSAEILNKYLQTRLEQDLVLDFRSELFAHAQRLSLAYHSRRRTGEFLARLTTRAAAVGRVALAALPLSQSVITLGGMFLVAFSLSPRLALLSLVVVPFVYSSIGYYTRRVEPEVRRVREMEGESLNRVHESLSLIRLVVAFGREIFEFQRFRSQTRDAAQARMQLTLRQMAFSWLVNLIVAAGIGLVLAVGAYQVLQGELTVGLLLVILTYVGSVYTPLQSISGALAGLQEKLADLEACFQVLDTEPEVRDLPGAAPLARCRGHLAFESVSFSYPERSATLTGVSFEAQPGQVIGVVGPTGAGKTTLVSLIPRFFDPLKGRVLLDGKDIRQLTLRSLRSHVSLVLQDPLLTSGTVADNIRYGRLDADEEEIRKAARAARAEEFIENLPDGYETTLGEGGAQLSGGERQRLSIARAILKDAPVLILDEPTSALDSKTEVLILQALDELTRGKTTFLISHRLSTVSRADLILVLKQGRIVEIGTFQELLSLGGWFKELNESQLASAGREAVP